jgi:hypothetical protein
MLFRSIGVFEVRDWKTEVTSVLRNLIDTDAVLGYISCNSRLSVKLARGRTSGDALAVRFAISMGKELPG